ncbi:hypothetical protein EUGRSUZ_D01980 [Eucalyptus grandis]|uniref:Uncharacterized protein n=2 Tax=Eucalyptus grandis TaxID=71139 RepID=A0ACC3L7I1_EUCGR|nr:hypothetical protein EUGRSUZ_D01980 [Eucalyptus grandis]
MCHLRLILNLVLNLFRSYSSSIPDFNIMTYSFRMDQALANGQMIMFPHANISLEWKSTCRTSIDYILSFL